MLLRVQGGPTKYVGRSLIVSLTLTITSQDKPQGRCDHCQIHDSEAANKERQHYAKDDAACPSSSVGDLECAADNRSVTESWFTAASHLSASLSPNGMIQYSILFLTRMITSWSQTLLYLWVALINQSHSRILQMHRLFSASMICVYTTKGGTKL